MSLATAGVALGVYAGFLAVGGVLGFVKARSRPSLIAGLASSSVAVALLIWSFWAPFPAIALAAVLATLLAAMFARRFSSTRKLMPSGMLFFVSLGMALFLAATAITNRP
jgi:uncharacterized membrane protein (UPF0136 family)